MLGGIAVNIVLGIFIFWMLVFKFGETYTPNDKLVNGIAPGKVGKEIGLEAGDRILALNGNLLKRFEDLKSSKVLLGNAELTLVRDGETKYVKVPGDIFEKIADQGIDEFVQPRSIFGIAGVVKGGNAEKAGIQAGDRVIDINNKPVKFFDELVSELQVNKGKTVAITVVRHEDTLKLNTAVTTEGTIGVELTQSIPSEKAEYGLVQSLPIGASKAWGQFSDNAKGLGKVMSGQVKAGKAFAGPIGIATMFGKTVNWVKFWTLVGVLSMALALMNLLPIPALDGGHAVFLLIEMIKGKPLSDKFMERAQLVGFVILITLMIFVFGNDIIKHVLN
jgi:regulator of sigma E protease